MFAQPEARIQQVAVMEVEHILKRSTHVCSHVWTAHAPAGLEA